MRQLDGCPYAQECATRQLHPRRNSQKATTDEPFFWMVRKRIRAGSVAFASARLAGAGGRLQLPARHSPTPPCAGLADSDRQVGQLVGGILGRKVEVGDGPGLEDGLRRRSDPESIRTPPPCGEVAPRHCVVFFSFIRFS